MRTGRADRESLGKRKLALGELDERRIQGDKISSQRFKKDRGGMKVNKDGS